jgi:glutathione peroxidase
MQRKACSPSPEASPDPKALVAIDQGSFFKIFSYRGATGTTRLITCQLCRQCTRILFALAVVSLLGTTVFLMTVRGLKQPKQHGIADDSESSKYQTSNTSQPAVTSDQATHDGEDVQGHIIPARSAVKSAAEGGQVADDLGLYDMGFTTPAADGSPLSVSSLRGKVTLFVNVASQCGYTKTNYEALQRIYERYHSYGLEIWAFPCNDFGSQEPWDESEILSFVKNTFKVSFTITSKIAAINSHPIFVWLRAHSPAADAFAVGAEEINWNFNKFLVDRRGHVVKRYPSSIDEAGLMADVYQQLVQNDSQQVADS